MMIHVYGSKCSEVKFNQHNVKGSIHVYRLCRSKGERDFVLKRCNVHMPDTVT